MVDHRQSGDRSSALIKHKASTQWGSQRAQGVADLVDNLPPLRADFPISFSALPLKQGANHVIW
jgi:hypothetical protein